MFYLTIHKYSHHFTVSEINFSILHIVTSFVKKFIRFSLTSKNNVLEPMCVFAASNKFRTEFRFHINQLPMFEDYFENHSIGKSSFNYIEIPLFESKDIKYNLRPNWVNADREHQTPIINYAINTDFKTKFIGLQTGGGKTFITCKSISLIGKLAVGIIRPMYIDKWVKDIVNYFDIDPKRILVVEGSKNLLICLDLAKNNKLDFDFILFSNKTIQNWIKLYEEHLKETLEFGYACLPQDLHKTLKSGVLFVDETHQDFHLNFKIKLYTHIEKTISLSGTLQHNDQFIKKMYEIMFPIEQRYKVPDYIKSARVFSVNYRFKNLDNIRTKEYGSSNYSHNRFELSIIRNNTRKENYFNLINLVSKEGYKSDYKDGQRLLIYCYRTETCELLSNYLKRHYPTLTVKKFTDEDPVENLYESDICVSTLGSASTAHDIKNLKTVINTVAVDSEQTNLQALGRLRKIDGVTTRFYYLTCQDIPKHVRYHKSKVDLFSSKVLSHAEINSNIEI